MADVEAFCDLVVTAKLEKVREQLAKQKALANCRLSGTPVLILAIDEELPIMTRTLLEAGADCAPRKLERRTQWSRETVHITPLTDWHVHMISVCRPPT